MTRELFDNLLNDYVHAVTLAQLAHDHEHDVTAAVIEAARHKVAEARETLWRAVNGT